MYLNTFLLPHSSHVKLDFPEISESEWCLATWVLRIYLLANLRPQISQQLFSTDPELWDFKWLMYSFGIKHIFSQILQLIGYTVWLTSLCFSRRLFMLNVFSHSEQDFESLWLSVRSYGNVPQLNFLAEFPSFGTI